MGIFAEFAPDYWRKKLPVIPCRGKRAFTFGWSEFAQRFPSEAEQAEWLSSYPDCNIGLPLGPCSGLVAVDIDTDDPAEIRAIRGCLPDTPYVRVGKKGMALIYRWNGEPSFKLQTADGRQPVEFLSAGNQVIVAPSIHPDTGKPYTASSNLWEVVESIPFLPKNFGKALLVEALGAPPWQEDKLEDVKAGGRHKALTSLAGQLRNRGELGERLSASLAEANERFESPLPAQEVESIAKWAQNIPGADVQFVRNDSGKIVAKSQPNIKLALAELGVMLSRDSFSGKDAVAGLDGYDGVLSDDAVRRLWFLINESFGFMPPKDFFWEVVLDEARQNAFDPVCDELCRLEAEWDGKPRLETWLSEYGGAEDTAYTRAVGRITLIAAARRARVPGVKYDNLAVFQGPQGTGKSTAVRIIAGDDQRFSDDIPFNADGREVVEALSGRWIMEAGELHGLRTATAEKLKSFLSRTVDHGRAAFARVPQAVPRRCIFIGTTNAANFLTDGTGNRRFWPVEVGTFNLLALQQDRDQLMGEAAHRESAGESIQMPADLWLDAAEVQDARRIENPIVSSLQAQLDGWTGRIRSADVWTLLGIPMGQRQAMARQVAGAMQELGWESKKYRFGGSTSERGFAFGTASEKLVVLTANPLGHVCAAPHKKEFTP